MRAAFFRWRFGFYSLLNRFNGFSALHADEPPAAGNKGFGLSPGQADNEVSQIESFFRFLPDSPEIYSLWRKLVVSAAVSGEKVHDARLVAVMLTHGLSHLITFNTADFKRYSTITALDPQDGLSIVTSTTFDRVVSSSVILFFRTDFKMTPSNCGGVTETSPPWPACHSDPKVPASVPVPE